MVDRHCGGELWRRAFDMISYKEALNIIIGAGAQKLLPVEETGIESIVGRVCAADITAPVANQPFDNSAMDGFALRAGDLAGAAGHTPVALDMIGHIAAGDSTPFAPLSQGQCYEIMTGAPLPAGCDAVVPVERTEVGADKKVLFRAAPGPGENIRRAGEDFTAGDPVFGKGHLLNAGHILTLATLGIGKVRVLRKPRMALIPTGREVVDGLGGKLDPGHIYNSTRPYLAAALPALGADIRHHETIPDDPGLFRKKLAEEIERNTDVIVSTGAVSAGAHDFIPSVLKEMSAGILFHKVAIRPGKPILFARFPGHGPLFVGLPGNPVAGAAGLRFFIRPLLRAMQGMGTEEPQYAILKNAWHSKGAKNLCFFMRVRTSHNGNGIYEAEIPEGQQSFKVRPFINTDSWGLIPEDRTILEAGDLIATYADH